MHILLLIEFWTNYLKTIGGFSSISGMIHTLQETSETVWRI